MMRSEYVEADIPTYAKAPAGKQVRLTTAGGAHCAPIAAPLRVECIDDLWGFTSLRSEWTELLGASAADNPFLTWEWLHAWWKHLHGGRTLQILTVRSEVYRLVGVAPLCVSRGRLPGLSQLEFLGTGWAGSDYLDLIARRGYERVDGEVWAAR